MEKDMVIRQKLEETGVPADMILQYQRDPDPENRQGQERLLCRFRRVQHARLKGNREKLTCLDCIIAKEGKTGELPQSR